MARFEWREFLDQRGIHYSVGAPHGKGIIGIRCPFCGMAGTDPTRHRMGIHPEKGWRCLRDETHRGKSPVRLVAALVDCSVDEARRICGFDDAEPAPMSIAAIEASMNDVLAGPHVEPAKNTGTLTFPDEIRRIDNAAYREHRIFMPYLEKRGYTRTEAIEVATLYGLRAAMSGPFAYRLVFPVETVSGLATWTGRAINDVMVPRYKTLATDAEKCKRERLPIAADNIKQCLWNARELQDSEGDLLLGCEGPFDGMRVDYYGRHYGIRATALFSKSLSKRQALSLSSIGKFERRALLLDEDALLDSYLQTMSADFANLDVIRIPRHVKDPAMLTQDDIRQIAQSRR